MVRLRVAVIESVEAQLDRELDSDGLGLIGDLNRVGLDNHPDAAIGETESVSDEELVSTGLVERLEVLGWPQTQIVLWTSTGRASIGTEHGNGDLEWSQW